MFLELFHHVSENLRIGYLIQARSLIQFRHESGSCAVAEISSDFASGAFIVKVRRGIAVNGIRACGTQGS